MDQLVHSIYVVLKFIKFDTNICYVGGKKKKWYYNYILKLAAES